MQPPSHPQPLMNPAEAWWSTTALRDDRPVQALLNSEARSGRVPRSVYELYSEMEEKDGHLYAALQTRLNGLLSLPRRVIAAAGDEASRQAAALAVASTEALPRFEELLRALLDGVAKGFAVVEVLWGYDAQRRLVPVDWIAHPQESFSFTERGELLLLAPPFRAPADAESSAASHALAAAGGRVASTPLAAFPAPERKFLVLRFGADFRNPWGRGLCQRAYWLYWFKKNALKFWASFCERYGAPTAIATCQPGLAPEDRARLREALEALQTESGIILPPTVELKLLEATRGGSGSSYREFLDWANDEVSKVVLGATLTTGEGRRSGSLALGSIHQLVRQDYIAADARRLEAVVGELLRWITELNFGSAAAAPRFVVECDAPEDLAARLAVDRGLLALGVPLPLSYFHQRYGRPTPAEGETPLRYDDANFYQYHLEFGVLTVNEVRARLGLPPIAGGDRPTSQGTAARRSTVGSAPAREDAGAPPV